jgi:segregation and condensation protein B
VADQTARRTENAQRARSDDRLLDAELEHLPAELRWREWMGRVEAVIFAAAKPVTREVLARVVGKSCNLDLIIDDIREELRGRPYELVALAGGWQHRTRKTMPTRSVLRQALAIRCGRYRSRKAWC